MLSVRPVDVVRFLRVLLEDRHGVAAGEYQGVEFVFASFEVGDHVVGDQRDARIAFDLFRIRYGEYFAGNPVFIKCFQVLEQSDRPGPEPDALPERVGGMGAAARGRHPGKQKVEATHPPWFDDTIEEVLCENSGRALGDGLSRTQIGWVGRIYLI